NSSDPTAGWCAYEFLVHQTKFNDYPKFGVWPAQNSYTMTAPQFNSTGGQGVWGFERDKMIACQTARFVYQDMVTLDPTLPRILPMSRLACRTFGCSQGLSWDHTVDASAPSGNLAGNRRY